MNPLMYTEVYGVLQWSPVVVLSCRVLFLLFLEIIFIIVDVEFGCPGFGLLFFFSVCFALLQSPASHYQFHPLDSLLSGLMLVRLFRVDQILWGRRKLCLADDIPITDEFKENTMGSTGMNRVQHSTKSVSSSYLLIHNYSTLMPLKCCSMSSLCA